ncbi:Nuclear pore complex protein [Nymphaea thermarum]|nr:Nuclear pore complex protein [Nymphaea thermarum]
MAATSSDPVSVSRCDGGSALGEMSLLKKRKISLSTVALRSADYDCNEAFLPTLTYDDYYIEPSLIDLANREHADAGYCSRVSNFMVGRVNYGSIRFFGETDVRWLNLDQIVRFNQNQVVVYEDEGSKPKIGSGLNKAAEVTLVLNFPPEEALFALDDNGMEKFVLKLKNKTEKQGARFISFNASNREWKFAVRHFSRFGFTEEDEDDMELVDATVEEGPENSREGTREEEKRHENDGMMVDEPRLSPSGAVLSHSLPAHLGLDPLKMQELRMVMFPTGEEDEVLFDSFSRQKLSFKKQASRTDAANTPPLTSGQVSTLQSSGQRKSHRITPTAIWGTPSPLSSSPSSKQALIEYDISKTSPGPSTNILMTQQNKAVLPRMRKIDGFRVDLKCETPVGNLSNAIVDAALFMGRSFRVGWGPNGLLAHSGLPVKNNGYEKGLSSLVNIEKVAFDQTVRDEEKKVKEELIDLRFISPLNLHKSLDHKTVSIQVGSFNLKLRRPICSSLKLPEVCRQYIEIVEQQFDVSGLCASDRVILMHQVMIWELIKVLFSERQGSSTLALSRVDDVVDMLADKKMEPLDIEPEAEPFVRRSEFSSWLQESVCHRVQAEVSRLNDGDDLIHIFSLLTGRQLDAAVELAACQGDVRLACLLSQAGGSMVSRSDMASQLEVWRSNGLDFNFIEKDRLRLYELLAGNIQGALHDSVLDWKRYLGLLMWYQLPPDTSLPVIIDTYEHLLDQEIAPDPVPVYIDEGLLEQATDISTGVHYDLAYYLMLLHAKKEETSGVLKTMFSSFSSTFDALDHHIIWHQRSILEAVGAFNYKYLYVLDMSLVSQLLCLRQCHWAIYVVLNMPQDLDVPGLHASVIKEILFQYCEIWSSHEEQRKFIEDLGIPSAWMDEALATYFQYYGNQMKAFTHLLACSSWQKAHLIFVISIAHSLFLSSEDSRLWKLATSLEVHKSEIADWDLGAGIYIDFYLLRGSLRGEDTMPELDSIDKKNVACRDFFTRLNKSLLVWGSKLPLDVRATYSEMANEMCMLLMCSNGEKSTCANQLNRFNTILGAPIPEDQRFSHMQDAVSAFTFWLKEGVLATDL